MKLIIVAACVVAYLAIGYGVAEWMGGDRSKLSSDVTYLDGIGRLLIMFFWPLLPLASPFAFLRDR